MAANIKLRLRPVYRKNHDSTSFYKVFSDMSAICITPENLFEYGNLIKLKNISNVFKSLKVCKRKDFKHAEKLVKVNFQNI